MQNVAVADAINSVLRTPPDYGVQVADLLGDREKRVILALQGSPQVAELYIRIIRAQRLDAAAAQLLTAARAFEHEVEKALVESQSHSQRLSILAQLDRPSSPFSAGAASRAPLDSTASATKTCPRR